MNGNNSLIHFSSSTELVVIPPDALAYVKADGNYSSLVLSDGTHFTLTMQLGQIESRLAYSLADSPNRFIRIGKSLIINRRFIALINPGRGRLVLADGRSFRHELTASREALKSLKEYIEKEVAL